MDSSSNESINLEMGKSPATPKVIKMSPITNLAHNLSGLTTSVAGTPIRRISWSNPIPGGDKIGLNVDDLSPYSNSDSPIAERSLKCIKKQHEDIIVPTFQMSEEMKKEVRKAQMIFENMIPDNYNYNKENLTPKLKKIHRPIKYSRSICDSGYMSGCLNSCKSQSSECLSPFTFIKSSSQDDERESVDQGIYLDDMDDPPVSDSFSNLFNKPLKETLRSPKQQSVTSKRYKLPMRRCLSTEMGFDPAAEPSSKSETFPNPEVSSSDQETDGNCNFKRPDPPEDFSGLQSKRRRSSPSIHSTPRAGCSLQRSYSETAATIMHAILKSDLQPELIGDRSRLCALPLIKGRHHDLMSIAPYTLAQLMNGEFKDVDSFVVVDCRFPYEFDGGHILGAKNIFTKEAIMEEFFAKGSDVSKRNIIIFHCEFSSERAPNLCRFLRNKDRSMNEGNYPLLNHPEIYILEGGYKAFFHSYKELCEPQAYKPMSHKDHAFECRYFRAKSKSWGADSKGRSQLRSHSKPSEI